MPTSVVVTGGAGYIGSEVCRLLARDPEVERVRILDVRRPVELPEKVEYVEADVTRSMAPFFEGVDVAVHLAWVLNPMRDRERQREINLEGTRQFLDACAAQRVRRVLAASSTTAYGAWPENPLPIAEDQLVRPDQPFQYAREKAIMEGMVRQWAEFHPFATTILFRPCIVLGPHVDNYIARSLAREVVMLVDGADPPMQFVHEDDVARAIVELCKRGGAGTYNVAADGTMRTTEVASLFGRRTVRISERVARTLASAAFRLGISSVAEAPGDIVPFLRHPWVADNRKLKATLGFQFRYDSRATLEEFARSRGLCA